MEKSQVSGVPYDELDAATHLALFGCEQGERAVEEVFRNQRYTYSNLSGVQYTSVQAFGFGDADAYLPAGYFATGGGFNRGGAPSPNALKIRFSERFSHANGWGWAVAVEGNDHIEVTAYGVK
jgi:hypothetical protein